MKASEKSLGVSVAALAVFGVALSARADIFDANSVLFNNMPVPEYHSAGGGTTAGSFAASAMMGAFGHSLQQQLPGDWETSITSLCATQTATANPTSMWPGVTGNPSSHCTPIGMAMALANLTGRSWVQRQWAATNQAGALNDTISALRDHGSPAVVPMYGQADHWVAIVQVTATFDGVVWTIGQVKIHDGGPVGQPDGSGNSYQSGEVSYSGKIWRMNYYLVVDNINASCDPCVNDPWYNQYVVMWEPPADHVHSAVPSSFPRSPGVAIGTVTEKVAQSMVWKSLIAAGINNNPSTWNAISDGVAGTALEVNAVSPAGERWDYFLVPIFASAGSANTVKAVVLLGAEDASFESVHVLATPGQFTPITKPAADLLARTTLKPGERLSAGILTWDPRAKTPFAKAPTFPYYEFGVLNGLKEVATVRVSFNKGAVLRTP